MPRIEVLFSEVIRFAEGYAIITLERKEDELGIRIYWRTNGEEYGGTYIPVIALAGEHWHTATVRKLAKLNAAIPQQVRDAIAQWANEF